MLIAARFAQGVGGAMTSAVILGMIVTRSGRCRTMPSSDQMTSASSPKRSRAREAPRGVHAPAVGGEHAQAAAVGERARVQATAPDAPVQRQRERNVQQSSSP